MVARRSYTRPGTSMTWKAMRMSWVRPPPGAASFLPFCCIRIILLLVAEVWECWSHVEIFFEILPFGYDASDFLHHPNFLSVSHLNSLVLILFWKCSSDVRKNYPDRAVGGRSHFSRLLQSNNVLNNQALYLLAWIALLLLMLSEMIFYTIVAKLGWCEGEVDSQAVRRKA